MKTLDILVVDDSSTDARILARIAHKGLGANVRTVGDGIDGLRDILATPPDVLLLDLNLPRLSGEEICRMVRSTPHTRNLPIVVVSSMMESKRAEMEVLGLGANAYLSKPFQPEHLIDAIRNSMTWGFIGGRIAEEMDRAVPPEAELAAETLIDTPASGIPVEQLRTPIPIRAEFGDYILQEIIGSGGFGTVYRAIQKRLSRPVAIKVLLSEAATDEGLRERFRREAKIMARLNHPNIVQIFDMGERQHTIYIAMELVEGSSLWDLIPKNGGSPLSYERQLVIVDQLCGAVSYMHGQGVIHRDIKPRNVLVTQNGNVKLGDFGISRTPRERKELQLTQVNQVIGTPFFMSPEAAAGEPSTPRSDIFSLGLTLWTMFAGSRDSIPGVVPLSERGIDIPRAFSEALEKCYAVEPGDRYATAEEARVALLAAAR